MRSTAAISATRARETYSFGPSIQWAAFDLGRVRQRIKQREAATDGALARYEQTVLQALEETDASLTAYAKAIVKQQHLQVSATASLEAARLARARYESGVADFLQVLDAERTALAAKISWRGARRRRRRRCWRRTRRWAAGSGRSRRRRADVTDCRAEARLR